MQKRKRQEQETPHNKKIKLNFTPNTIVVDGVELARYRDSIYFISKCSMFIYNINTQRYLKPRRQMCFYLNGKSIKVYIHLVVLRSWRGEAPEGHSGDHIDIDYQNHHLENLRWVTNSVQSKNRNPYTHSNVRVIQKLDNKGCVISEYMSATEAAKTVNRDPKNIYMCCSNKLKTSGGSTFRFKPGELDPLPGEIWKVHPFISSLKVSTKGRVWSYKMKTKKPFYGKMDRTGYYRFLKKLVHRLVYETFISTDIKEDNIIDHINEVKTDNRVENLQQITRKENIKKCWENGKLSVRRKTKLLNF
jgi:hypothetical protein